MSICPVYILYFSLKIKCPQIIFKIYIYYTVLSIFLFKQVIILLNYNCYTYYKKIFFLGVGCSSKMASDVLIFILSLKKLCRGVRDKSIKVLNILLYHQFTSFA